MLKNTIIAAACVLICPGALFAQTKPSTLATIFDDVFGPNGLVVSSDDVLLDGTNHAAHFNSSFQSDFRLMNIALTSQLTAVPLPSPASGFTYKFDPSTGTFVRSTRSFGPILTDRGETIGRGRIAFGANFQSFSFDRLDGVTLTDVPAVFRHDDYRTTAGRSDVISTRNTIDASVSQFSARADLRPDRSHRLSPSRFRWCGRAFPLHLECDHQPGRHGRRSGRALFPRSGCARWSRDVPSVHGVGGSRRYR